MDGQTIVLINNQSKLLSEDLKVEEHTQTTTVPGS